MHTQTAAYIYILMHQDLSYMSVIHMEQLKPAIWGVRVNVEETNTSLLYTHIVHNHTPLPIPLVLQELENNIMLF